MVVLEGLCRFNVQDLSTRGTYYTARITPLEMTKAGDMPIHIFFLHLILCSAAIMIIINVFLFYSLFLMI